MNANIVCGSPKTIDAQNVQEYQPLNERALCYIWNKVEQRVGTSGMKQFRLERAHCSHSTVPGFRSMMARSG